MEHYVFGLYSAQLISATYLMHNPVITSMEKHVHNGGDQYSSNHFESFFELPHLNRASPQIELFLTNQSIVTQNIKYPELLGKLKQNIPFQCGSLYQINLRSCLPNEDNSPHDRCNFLHSYFGTWEISKLLRNSNFKEKCHLRQLGFPMDSAAINILWHVRTGDICLHCRGGEQYYPPLINKLKHILDGIAPYNFTFLMQKTMDYVPHLLRAGTASRSTPLLWIPSARCSPVIFSSHQGALSPPQSRCLRCLGSLLFLKKEEKSLTATSPLDTFSQIRSRST
jgi:hypothetical protein